MIKNSIDENMRTSNADNTECSGQELYETLMYLNENMLEKEQELISIKLQLKTLENNINAQVDEFIKSLAVSHDNLHVRFLEVQRNNEELRKIKEFILNCKLDSSSFTFKRILARLGIKSIEEIYDLNAIQKIEEAEKSVTASLIHDQQKSESIEEEKYMPEASEMPSNRKRVNPINVEQLDEPTNPNRKKNQQEIKMKEDNFEDEAFKFGILKNKSNTFSTPKSRDPNRKRATSNSLLESSFNPVFQARNETPGEIKRFKENESSTIDNSRSLPQVQRLGALPSPSTLPFAPNIPIDPETICQMLIRKLAANGGLNNLNDIFRILPDNLLGRGRSNTE